MPYVGVSHPGWDGQWIPATVGNGLEAQVNRLQDRLGAMTAEADKAVAERDRLRVALDELHTALTDQDGSDCDHARLLDAAEHARVVLDASDPSTRERS